MLCNTYEGNKFEFHEICLEDNKEKISLSLTVDHKFSFNSDKNIFVENHGAMAYWLVHWILNPGVSVSKPLGGSKSD